MDRSSVEEEVRSAFHGVSLGSGMGLWEAQAIDDYQSEEVRKQQRERDQKESWELIPGAELQRCHSSLSFFDADGMRFHLPAYIIASLRDEVDDPIFHLVHLDEYAISKLTSLNGLQRMSIISYLRFCLERDEYEFEHTSISRALGEYWER
ncbi:MAG: DUF6714 family protein [Pseudomonadota bacterium]